MALPAIDSSPPTAVEDSTFKSKEPDTISKTVASGSGEYKEDSSPLSDIDDTAVLEKGSLDPVYEAKARVLNHAVCVPFYPLFRY